MVRRTAGLLVASLVLALSATPLTPSVRAVGATTWIVAHEDEVLEYTVGSACADPDFWTDGSWSEPGSGDGAYDSDEDAIQDAIDNAASGDTIYVCFGRYEFDTDLHNIDPGMDLTIVGDGIGDTVLDGTNSTRLINANPVGEDDDGGTLTLQDLSMEDARTESVFDNGGAVNADGLSLTRVSISGSDNAYNGGALYAEGDVTIVDSTFTDNDTSEGGAVLYAWNSVSTVTISNSVFDGNTAGQVGGAINATTVTVTGSTFTNNDAAVYGGAINATTVTVTGSTFTDNDADDDGGAIKATTVTVTGSTFTNNSSTIGGAIYADTTATVTASSFTNNAAALGGAILSYTATATNSTFTNNNAATLGGAIATEGDVNVTNSTFANNDAALYGGAIYTSTGTIARSRFTQNTAGENGGAVALLAPDNVALQQLRGNTFSRNIAAAGGAITLGPCIVPTRSQAARVERANRFRGNRATEQRRTSNIERWDADICGD
jgi:predicted outer membrane repeat protein